MLNKNNNFLSLKLNLVLNFDNKNKNIRKKGMSIPICFAKNITGCKKLSRKNEKNIRQYNY